MSFYDLTEEEQREAKSHTKGVLVFIAGILGLPLGIALVSTALIVISLIALPVGFFWMILTRSDTKIREEKRINELRGELLVSSIKAGVSAKDVVDTLSGEKERREKAETKEIIKGAAIGAVVAGDAGAIVGATIAKNKIDNRKKNS